jgi:signal transduction histidine kinase/CheY-like chemotaxis protein/HPt (histidine-containing phosphotransfer) domain-containing protein
MQAADDSTLHTTSNSEKEIPVRIAALSASVFILAAVILISGIFLIIPPVPLAGQAARAGVIDLRAWTTPDRGLASLAGNWRVWKGVLLNPEQAATAEPTGATAAIPGLWEDQAPLGMVAGVATYAATLELPGTGPDYYCLIVGRIPGAVRLYVDGKLRLSAGEMGDTAQAYRPGSNQGVVILPAGGRTVSLLLQVANFNEPNPGVWDTPLIGSPQAIYRHHDLRMAHEITIFASLLVLGTFVLLFYFFRKHERSLLYLSLFAILMGIRYLFLGYRFPYTIFPELNWEQFEKVHFACYYLGVAVFLHFLMSNYPHRHKKTILIVAWAVSGMFTLLTLVTDKIIFQPPASLYHIFSAAIFIYCQALLVLAIRQKRPYAILFFISTCILLVGAVSDTVVYYIPIDQPQITAPLVVLFLFFQTIVLSWRFNADFMLSRNLASELRRILYRQDQIQEGLEKTVVERTQALSHALDEATVANKAKTEFLANMSHEIRTPLNAIIGVCEVMTESNRDGHENASVRLILTEATRLLNLMNQLLDISKIEANKMVLENHPFDLREMFDTIDTTMNLRTVASDIRFSQQIDTSVPRYVRGDPLRLRQVLDNLLGNALKFTEAGSISLFAAAAVTPDRRIELNCRLTDTGIGIPPERQSTIFDTFQQADSSTTRVYGGSGLGTSISRSLVELMGGHISLESQPGKGSRFTFTVMLDLATEGELPGGHLRDHQTEPFWQTAPRALLVEDYLLNAEIIARHLTNAGWVVTTATNGQIAVDSFFQNTFDLVIMDIHMPVMDGLEATRQIRARAQREVPIIGLSASAFKEDHDRAQKAGMNELVAKPIRRRPLLEVLARYVPPGSYVESSTSYLNQAVARLLPVSTHHLLKDLDGDLGLFLTMVFGFLKESRRNLNHLRVAIASGDSVTVHRLAHSIKGGAQNLGAATIAQAAFALEHSAKMGGEDWGKLLALLENQVSLIETIVEN